MKQYLNDRIKMIEKTSTTALAMSNEIVISLGIGKIHLEIYVSIYSRIHQTFFSEGLKVIGSEKIISCL